MQKVVHIKNEQANKLKNKLIWLVVICLFLAGLYANYTYFSDWSGYLRVAFWIVLFLALVGISLFTTKGQSAKLFLQSARAELRKVSWPTRQETTQTTLIVLVMIVVVALILWGVDGVFTWLVGWLTG